MHGSGWFLLFLWRIAEAWGFTKTVGAMFHLKCRHSFLSFFLGTCLFLLVCVKNGRDGYIKKSRTKNKMKLGRNSVNFTEKRFDAKFIASQLQKMAKKSQQKLFELFFFHKYQRNFRLEPEMLIFIVAEGIFTIKNQKGFNLNEENYSSKCWNFITFLFIWTDAMIHGMAMILDMLFSIRFIVNSDLTEDIIIH